MDGSQAGMQCAGKPTRVGRENASPFPLVVLSTPAQQDADAYCHDLPLQLCHGCDGCGMRCTEGVRMSFVEFRRIQQFIADHWEETAVVQAQDKSIPGWPVTQFCQFRDTQQDRCAIYPVRPAICRFFGHTEWLPCPLEVVPLRGQDAMDVYQRYAKQDLRTFEQWIRSRRENQAMLPTDEHTVAD